MNQEPISPQVEEPLCIEDEKKKEFIKRLKIGDACCELEFERGICDCIYAYE